MCGMSTVRGKVVGDKIVSTEQVNGIPLIHTEDQDQFVITNFSIMESSKKIGNPFQDIPNLAAPRLIGDMKNYSPYIWESNALNLYDSSVKIL